MTTDNKQVVVSCIMNTFRRFTCVNRSVKLFLKQDIEVKTELIIYNTDTEYPLVLDSGLEGKNIKIINNNTDFVTGLPYNNIGSIRRDSLNFGSGKYYICWDDDDIFLPWHIRQCVDGYNKNSDIWAWKPFTSMFWKTNHEPELAWNSMEASILVDLEQIKKAGFHKHQGGGEHLHWMDVFKKQKKFYVEKESVPSYCFNWADQGLMRGHKQSGTINREDNFEHHKKNTTDHAKGPVTADYDISDTIKRHVNSIHNNIGKEHHEGYIIKKELVEKYVHE